MENLNFSEKYDTDPGTLPPGYFCTQTFKKRFNVRPFDITADRSGKNKFQCFSVFSFHRATAPFLKKEFIIALGSWSGVTSLGVNSQS